jgi:hypothetical protein
MAKQDDYVTFVVQYEDGKTDLMDINRVHLQRGDHVVATMAREAQEKGHLLQGKIKSIARASD